MNLELRKISPEHPDFLRLVKALDEELKITDGPDHLFYHQFNGLDDIKHVILGYAEKEAIACGAFKSYDQTSVEIKRMYTSTHHRGKGAAKHILGALESWAQELGFNRCILETGVRQIAAIVLYEKCGYRRIENYGQYANVAGSVCFEKKFEQEEEA